MDMKKKHIRSECRLLVESILSENLVDANGLLKRLLNRIEDMREDNAISLVMEQDDGSAPADADTDLTEAEEGGEGETDGEGNDLGDDLAEVQGDGEAAEAEGDDDEESVVGNAKLAEMGNDEIALQCEINEKMISIYTDRLSNLKTQLNAMGLNKQEREYVTFEMQISYYSKKLRELQDKCEVTVDQDEVKERLAIIEAAIKTIESQIAGGGVPEVKSTEELDADETGDDAGDEGEAEAEGEGEAEGEAEGGTEAEGEGEGEAEGEAEEEEEESGGEEG